MFSCRFHFPHFGGISTVHYFTVPDVPRNLKVTSTGITYVSVSWEGPSAGRFDGYELSWEQQGSSSATTETVDNNMYEIKQLQAGTSYVITIVAVSNGLKSASESVTQETCE